MDTTLLAYRVGQARISEQHLLASFSVMGQEAGVGPGTAKLHGLYSSQLIAHMEMPLQLEF